MRDGRLVSLNIGGSGQIQVDQSNYELDKHDCLYIGRGSKRIQFTSDGSSDPAIFVLMSYPAHREYPTTFS